MQVKILRRAINVKISHQVVQLHCQGYICVAGLLSPLSLIFVTIDLLLVASFSLFLLGMENSLRTTFLLKKDFSFLSKSVDGWRDQVTCDICHRHHRRCLWRKICHVEKVLHISEKFSTWDMSTKSVMWRNFVHHTYMVYNCILRCFVEKSVVFVI